MMEWISYFWNMFIHLDKHLGQVIYDYGLWTYLILFFIIFCETGLVVTPFLPGDSLLFAAGSLAGNGITQGMLNPWWLFVIMSTAAILGDTANYWIGAWIGPKAFSGHYRFLKKEHLERTHAFYEKYGGKTIIIARFIPIIRTFAPFVAGIGAMHYGKFILYNIIGGMAWVALFVFGGYWLGGTEFAKNHFSVIVVAIILISVMPMVFEFWRAYRERKLQQNGAQ